MFGHGHNSFSCYQTIRPQPSTGIRPTAARGLRVGPAERRWRGRSHPSPPSPPSRRINRATFRSRALHRIGVHATMAGSDPTKARQPQTSICEQAVTCTRPAGISRSARTSATEYSIFLSKSRKGTSIRTISRTTSDAEQKGQARLICNAFDLVPDPLSISAPAPAGLVRRPLG